MITKIILMFAVALVTATYFVISRKRNAPRLRLNEAALPSIEEALGLFAGLSGGSVHKNNSANVLQNGDFFTAVMDDIRCARSTIHLETFVWKKGLLEKSLVALLCEKTTEGVKVRVLLDAVGARHSDQEQLAKLRSSGVSLALYRPISWFNLRRYNNRTHRKLLIVDGEIGFTFGHGIADEWLGNAQDKEHVRDTGVRLQGSVVSSLQSAFVKDWVEAKQEVPVEASCFPGTNPCGAVTAHVVSSIGGNAYSSVALLYVLAIASARREIIIQTPYFTPDRLIVSLLENMAKRGVAVHLMIPGEYTDSAFVRRAGQQLYLPLLRAGARLYEFKPTLLHQKIVIVDEAWSHIGSTNLDARSLALNAETGVGFLDKNIARELRRAFEVDLQRSEELILQKWQRRPQYQQFLDWCAYQLHGQI